MISTALLGSQNAVYREAFAHGEGRAGWAQRNGRSLLGMFQAPDSILELETKPLKATKPNGPVFCLLGVNSAVYLIRTLRGSWGDGSKWS